MLKSTISSLIRWKFFTPSCVASSFTMIGGLIVMTFFGSSSTEGATSASGAGGVGGGSTGPGGGVVKPGFATNFEIGGKIVVRTFGVPSVALALGRSINDTVSILVGFWVFSPAEGLASARPTAAPAFSFTGAT